MRRRIGALFTRLSRARTNLRLRITLGVTLTLAVLIAAFIVVRYRQLQQEMLRAAEANIVSAGQVIEDSLEQAMLTQNSSELQRIMDNVSRQPNIRSLILLNNSSVVRFAAPHDPIGAYVDKLSPGCADCHRAQERQQGSTILLGLSTADPLLRYCIPIPNLQQCHACHSAATPINGALIADFSLAETQSRIDAELRTDALAGLLLLAASALVVNLLLDRLVLARLDRMTGAMRRFGAGDSGQRVDAGRLDEIGQLATTFNQMADGLQAQEREAERLYQELQGKESARRQLLQRIIEVQEEERKRIARELHDDFAQTLTALTLGLETAMQVLPPANERLKRQLAQVQDLTVTTLGRTHEWIQDLRPRVLDDLGLVAAIRWYAETRLAERGVEVSLDLGHPRWRLPVELETVLFRVVQEAVNNVAKHASARHARIRLEVADAHVYAWVEDDGVGFDADKFLTTVEGMRGIGLLGMRERVALVGGTLRVTSAAGQGTQVHVEVPWTQ